VRQAYEWVNPLREPQIDGVILTDLCVYQAEMGLAAAAHDTWKRIPPFSSPVLDVKRRATRGLIYLADRDFELARADFEVAVSELQRFGNSEWAYYTLLLALAELGAGDRSLATKHSAIAARFFVDRDAGEIAVAATTLLKEASCQSVGEHSIRKLARVARRR
jgi:hypothetical protein